MSNVGCRSLRIPVGVNGGCSTAGLKHWPDFFLARVPILWYQSFVPITNECISFLRTGAMLSFSIRLMGTNVHVPTALLAFIAGADGVSGVGSIDDCFLGRIDIGANIFDAVVNFFKPKIIAAALAFGASYPLFTVYCYQFFTPYST